MAKIRSSNSRKERKYEEKKYVMHDKDDYRETFVPIKSNNPKRKRS